ncbi:MAG: hypothetical protein MK538_13930, partial [Planctomycetes bacterium]|nr:hypothetical protein [Planctomycetota bacterium]
MKLKRQLGMVEVSLSSAPAFRYGAGHHTGGSVVNRFGYQRSGTSAPVAAVLIFSALAWSISNRACATRIDLRASHDGDRIAVVRQGKVAYLPAQRVELIPKVSGGGYARYIRRSRNGDLHVMGSGIEGTLLRSEDGGLNWKSHSYKIDDLRFLSAFIILRDDTFLIVFMSHAGHDIHVGRSQDGGRSWRSRKLDLDLQPYNEAMGYNSGLLELSDGS